MVWSADREVRGWASACTKAFIRRGYYRSILYYWSCLADKQQSGVFDASSCFRFTKKRYGRLWVSYAAVPVLIQERIIAD